VNKKLLQFIHQSPSQPEFGSVKYRLMKPESGCGLTDEQADWAIAQYICFLMLFWLYPNTNYFVPSKLIDRVWHCHLLDTQKYMKDCQLLFGSYIHHFPFYVITKLQAALFPHPYLLLDLILVDFYPKLKLKPSLINSSP